MSAILMLGGLAGYIGWDVYAAFQQDQGTLSEVLGTAFWEFPALTFAAGVVLGHWTWPQKTVRPGWETAIIVAAVGAALLALEYFTLLPHPSWLVPVIPLLLGILAGHWLWPQREPELPTLELQ